MSDPAAERARSLIFSAQRADPTALVDLAPLVPASLLGRAIECALRLLSLQQRVEAVTALAVHLSLPDRERLADALLSSLHEAAGTTELPRTDTLRLLAARLVEIGLPERAAAIRSQLPSRDAERSEAESSGVQDPERAASRLTAMRALSDAERDLLFDELLGSLERVGARGQRHAANGGPPRDRHDVVPQQDPLGRAVSRGSIRIPRTEEPGKPSTQRVSPPERVVNTGFASRRRPDLPFDPDSPLTVAQPCLFWLEVGPPLRGSIEQTPSPLPLEHLPEDAVLTVALFSLDGRTELAAGTDVGELRLDPSGAVTVTRQPAVPQGLAAGSELLKRRLFFPLTTPSQPGELRLRCNIYHHDVLVQSRLVRARVAVTPLSTPGALRSDLDYTLSRALEPARLARLQPHRLSLMLNDNGDGTHGFAFFGSGGELKSSATLDAHLLQDLIQQARGALRLAAWGKEGEWDPTEALAYRYEGGRDLARLRGDLVRFAIRGYRIYSAVVSRLTGGSLAPGELADRMLPSGLIQIAMKESPSYVLPAAMVYDYIGFDSQSSPERYTLCDEFLASLDRPAPLEEVPCFQGACPANGSRTVVCPSGFWGFRHALGLPVSLGSGGADDAPADVAVESGPRLAVAVWAGQDFQLREAHVASLQRLREGQAWNYADTRDETFALIAETKPHVFYLYCHGGVAGSIPFLKVGGQDDPPVTTDNLLFRKPPWDGPRPLVFINGCKTTALEPLRALEFVTAFVQHVGAAGVVGTETTVFEPLARAFGEACLSQYLGGMPIGESVRRARLALLKQGNPLGLVYIPFALANLRLVPTVPASPP